MAKIKNLEVPLEIHYFLGGGLDLKTRGERMRLSDYGLVLGGLFLSADIFGLDLWMPEGITSGVLYALVVMLGLLWPGKGYIFGASLLGTALVITAHFYVEAPETTQIDRGLAILVIWMTACLCLGRHNAVQRKLELQKRINWVHFQEAAVSARPNQTETLNSALDILCSLIECETAVLGKVVQPSSGPSRIQEIYSAGLPIDSSSTSLHTIWSTILSTGQAYISNDPAPDPAIVGLSRNFSLQTFLGLPFYHNGKILGVLGLVNRAEGFDEELVQIVQSFLPALVHFIAFSNVQNELKETQALLDDKDKVSETTEETVQSSEAREKAEKSLLDSVSRMKQAVEERNQFQEALKERDERILHIDRERELAEFELLENRERLHSMELERKRLDEELNDREEKIRRGQRDMDRLEEQNRDKDDRFRRVDRDRLRLEEMESELESRVKKLQRARKEEEENVQALEEKLQNSEKQSRRLQESLKEYEQGARLGGESFSQESRELLTRLEQHDKTIEHLRSELKKSQEDSQSSIIKLQQVQENLNHTRITLKEKEDQLEVAAKEKVRLQKILRGSEDRKNESDRGMQRMIGEMKELQSRKDAILNTAEEGILGLGLKGDIVFANESVASMLGMTVAELVGRKLADVFMHSSEDGRMIHGEEDPILKMLKTGKQLTLPNEVFWRKDGTCLYMDLHVSPIWEDDSQTGAVVALLNTTDRQRLIEELEQNDQFMDEGIQIKAEEMEQRILRLEKEIDELQSKESELMEESQELARKNSDLDDFASVVSRDFEEPLRKVIHFSEMLRSEGVAELGDRARGYLDRVESVAIRMRKRMEDLLDYSRISSYPGNTRLIKLSKVVDSVLSALASSISETHAKIEVGELPSIEADKIQMHQLFENLLSNALKYVEGNKSPEISIQSRNCGDGIVEITVKDNGIGFDEKNLDRIFRPFDRLHGHSAYKGNGLGLAICKKIVERHGGKITAKSAPGQGSTFIVQLPEQQNRATLD
jgi:PAS domain S-box-containing protein